MTDHQPWMREPRRIETVPEWQRALDRVAAQRRVALKRRIRARLRQAYGPDYDLPPLWGLSEPLLLVLALGLGVAVE